MKTRREIGKEICNVMNNAHYEGIENEEGLKEIVDYCHELQKVKNLTTPRVRCSAYLCKNVNGEDAIIFANNIAGVFDKLDDITPNPELVEVAGKSTPPLPLMTSMNQVRK